MAGGEDETGWTPLIVAVAPTGARRTKRDHPRLPTTPQEIAREARVCLEAGASMLHLHVRDRGGNHTLDVDAYRAAITAIKAEVGDRMVVQVTTEAVRRFTPQEQAAAVRALRPEAISLAVRELIPNAREEASAVSFLDWCRRERVSTQYILYDVEDLRRLSTLLVRGVVPSTHLFRLYVLGRYAPGASARPVDLLPFMASDDGREDPWAVCAFGNREAACTAIASALGGHVRVGFENNLHLPDGTLAESNAELVAVAVSNARTIGRPLADADALRSAITAWD